MPTRTTTLDNVYAYNGSLASLLGNLVVSNFEPETSGTLQFEDNDDDFAFEGGEAATFDPDGADPAEAVSYVGGGTATVGVSLGGLITIPLGTTVPVDVFASAGTTYFHYPEGDQAELLAGLVTGILNTPGIGATLALLGLSDVTVLTTYVEQNAVLTFDLNAADALPICFCPGTMISTPTGERPVEELKAGDLVLDIHGQAHRIRWTGASTRSLAALPRLARERFLPVVIPAGAFGGTLPRQDLRLSQQHRVLVGGAMVEMYFGMEEALTTAKSLVGDVVRLDRSARFVTYHHILCDRHVVVHANGLPAETLLPREVAASSIGEDHWEEVLELFPELADSEADAQSRVPASPILRTFEGALLARAGLLTA